MLLHILKNKILFAAFFVFSLFSNGSFAKTDGPKDVLETPLVSPWVNTAELQRLKPLQREMVVESTRTLLLNLTSGLQPCLSFNSLFTSSATGLPTCNPPEQGQCPTNQVQCDSIFGDKICVSSRSSITQCSIHADSPKKVARQIEKRPAIWSHLGETLQGYCQLSQSRSGCYRSYQQMNDTRRVVTLDNRDQQKPPEEVHRRASAPVIKPTLVNDSGKPLSTCRVNLLIEAVPCQPSDENKPAMSFEEIYDVFCRKVSSSNNWQKQFQDTLNQRQKCLTQNSKSAALAYDRGWAQDALKRLTLDLIPNFQQCQKDFNAGLRFDQTKIGEIDSKNGNADIQVGSEQIVTQKSYTGAVLDSRRVSLCQFNVSKAFFEATRLSTATAGGTK